MENLYCQCCSKPFRRPSSKGRAPFYCSVDCRRQMAVRANVWTKRSATAMAGDDPSSFGAALGFSFGCNAC